MKRLAAWGSLKRGNVRLRGKTGAAPGFTGRYGVHLLVYAEFHETMPDAILREKQIKKWRRKWKLDLIERDNPEWRDLYADMNL